MVSDLLVIGLESSVVGVAFVRSTIRPTILLLPTPGGWCEFQYQTLGEGMHI